MRTLAMGSAGTPSLFFFLNEVGPSWRKESSNRHTLCWHYLGGTSIVMYNTQEARLYRGTHPSAASSTHCKGRVRRQAGRRAVAWLYCPCILALLLGWVLDFLDVSEEG